MKRNVGLTDRRLRIGAGIAILVLGVLFQSWWGLIGLVPLLTGLSRRCPAYALFGFSTCETKPERHAKAVT